MFTIVNNSKHMRDKHYSVMAFRLDENNRKWLKEKRRKSKSWNLTFNEIRKKDEGIDTMRQLSK